MVFSHIPVYNVNIIQRYPVCANSTSQYGNTMTFLASRNNLVTCKKCPLLKLDTLWEKSGITKATGGSSISSLAREEIFKSREGHFLPLFYLPYRDAASALKYLSNLPSNYQLSLARKKLKILQCMSVVPYLIYFHRHSKITKVRELNANAHLRHYSHTLPFTWPVNSTGCDWSVKTEKP